MSTERIRALNDRFRTTFEGGRIAVSDGASVLPQRMKAAIFKRIRAFDAFDEPARFCEQSSGDASYGEHDFGTIEVAGKKIIWKIDYDAEMVVGSEDPADPLKTIRVLTIMLANEY